LIFAEAVALRITALPGYFALSIARFRIIWLAITQQRFCRPGDR